MKPPRPMFGPIVVVLALAIFLERWDYHLELLEKYRAEATARALQAALRNEMGNMLLHGAAHRWGELASQNPFSWLQAKSDDYCGEVDDVEEARPGCWVYRRREGYVAYRPRHTRFFHTLGAAPEIRYRLIIHKQKKGNDGAKVDTVTLELVYPFQWF